MANAKTKTEHYAAALMDLVIAECENSGENACATVESTLAGALRKLHTRGFSDWEKLLHHFENEIDRRFSGKKVEVISAVPLTATERKEISETLSGAELVTEVDPAVQGGVRIEMDGVVIDATIKTMIEKLRLALATKL